GELDAQIEHRQVVILHEVHPRPGGGLPMLDGQERLRGQSDYGKHGRSEPAGKAVERHPELQEEKHKQVLATPHSSPITARGARSPAERRAACYRGAAGRDTRPSARLPRSTCAPPGAPARV